MGKVYLYMLYLTIFCDDRDPLECLREEFFLKALPLQQAQCIRRNKGSSSVVEATEDYITPDHIFNKNISDRKHPNLTPSTHLKPVDTSRQTREVKFKDKTCYKCKRTGHLAFESRTFPGKEKQRQNQASYFVCSNIGDKLINIPGKVKNGEISFVKDTDCDMTLVWEDLVDTNCVLQGQNVTL